MTSRCVRDCPADVFDRAPWRSETVPFALTRSCPIFQDPGLIHGRDRIQLRWIGRLQVSLLHDPLRGDNQTEFCSFCIVAIVSAAGADTGIAMKD